MEERRSNFSTVKPSVVRFNGATAMSPWKSGVFRRVGREARIPELQWGHVDVDVEETIDRQMNGRDIALYASWGPRRCAVEEDNGACERGQDGHIRFNGATSMMPWKRTVRICGSNQAALGSFNGATSMVPWKRARLPDRLEQRT